MIIYDIGFSLHKARESDIFRKNKEKFRWRMESKVHLHWTLWHYEKDLEEF
jgi:hypothetical protein